MQARASIAATGLALAWALVLAVIAPPAAADIWKFVDRNGGVHLSDRPMGPGSKLLVRGKKRLKHGSVASRNTLRDFKETSR